MTSPTASQAATVTFSPSADAYVDASRPDMNFGTVQKIRTDGSPVVRSYLRFDVTGVSGTVQKATLSLVPASSLRGAVTASAVADNTWSEKTITNTNAPAPGATLSSAPSAVTATPTSFDVTRAVTGNGPVSIAVTSSSVTALAIWSREAGGTNVPQLVVDAPTDTTAPSAPDGLTATGSDKQVSLAWNAATDDTGVTGYRVYRQNADGSWPTTATATTAAGTRSFTDTGLTDGTAYTYRVTAIDGASNESAPSATASTTPQAPPPPPPPANDPQPPFPVRGAFVYPWFPESWSQSGMNPFTHYHPSTGLYDSGSTAVVQQQIQAMQYGKIDLGIASWWGQGSKTDSRISTLLSTTDAMNSSFRWALYYEPEGQGDPTVAQLTSDLAYIRDHYGNDPSYYRVNGRFVVFVYADGADACGMADRWSQANALINAYVVLKVFSGYRNCLNQPARWHQYAPAVAQDSQSGYSFAISPGFFKGNEATPRLARDLTRWNTNVRAMVASKAPFQLVTTFDEWGEGTSVESADEWTSSSGYGAYLDALHSDGQAPPPPPPPTDTTAPSAPGNLAAAGGNAQVSLAWDAATDDVGVTGYRVYRQNADGTWPTTPTATTPAATRTFADSGRANGTTYTYRVTAIDAAGNESAPSATASATPQAPPDTTAPSAPGGLNASAGNGTVALTWNAATDDTGVAGYRVYRQNADGSWPTTATASTAAATRSFTDSGRTNGTTYTYRVTAIDAAGNESAPSATASATPQAPPDTTAPSAPGGLTATGGNGTVALAWNASTDNVGVTGYRVYRQNADGSWPTTATATTAAATRSFTDTGRTNGTTYTYRVTAIDAAGNESAPSATASATPQAPPDTTAPSAPGGLTATSGDTKVTLSWSASTDNVGVASYRIYRQNADGSWPLTSTGNTPSGTRT
ncbi:MAG TPA: fibronectin type III domain-containing protein, partial [Thermoleophilaceae bacterium]|nr:fibronectin type III domain-containing protein [Thermoleophilaceae bacterium]